MAQRISKEEYSHQSSEYTKKALSDLNNTMAKEFKKPEIDNDIYDDCSDADSFLSMPKKRKRSSESTVSDVSVYNQLIKMYQTNNTLNSKLFKYETEAYHLKLDLSNANCEISNQTNNLKYMSFLNKKIKAMFLNIFFLCIFSLVFDIFMFVFLRPYFFNISYFTHLSVSVFILSKTNYKTMRQFEYNSKHSSDKSHSVKSSDKSKQE